MRSIVCHSWMLLHMSCDFSFSAIVFVFLFVNELEFRNQVCDGVCLKASCFFFGQEQHANTVMEA